MKSSRIPTLAALGCGLMLLVWLGCDRDSAVSMQRDQKGNDQIHINRQKIDDSLHKAGNELKQDAQKLGSAVQDGAQDLDHKLAPATRETRESLADAALTTRVKARLLATPDLGGIHIHVNSRQGEVTLTGTVSTTEDRHYAEKIASRTTGVNSVVNQLEVGPVG